MSMRFHDDTRNTIADAFAALCNGGSIQLRTGARPTNITDAATGTLLATVTLPNPCFGAAAEGTITANAITAVTGDATGDIGHFRVLTSGGAVVEDSESVGTSGTELVVNTTTVTTGESVEITGWTWTMPAE